MLLSAAPARLARRLARLRRETRAVALLEFALGLPLLMGFGMYGVELTSLALANLKISQIALTLADNGSRIGVDDGLNQMQLNEADINDVLEAARTQGANLELTTHGRVTISSLKTNASDGQYLYWQRCIGTAGGAGYDSSYGTEGDGATGTSFPGMGEAGSRVTAPVGGAVVFVEINYDYQPVTIENLIPPQKIHFVASFIVRDKRDLTKVYPSAFVTPSSCSIHDD